MEKTNKSRSLTSGVLIKIIIFIGVLIFLVATHFIVRGMFRLDQYATTILGTTAGVVGSMFGLTAASYAFIWADLRSDRQENRHLGKVLDSYRQKLWNYFRYSLFLTVIVILTSLLGLVAAQNITEPILSRFGFENWGIITHYQNKEFCGISVLTLINCELSIAAVVCMAIMNRYIFRRDFQYSKIAKKIMRSIECKYDMSFYDKDTSGEGNIEKKESVSWDSIEYEKIHNLEVLVERILKNHESIGNAFAESQRREKLLSAIITNELDVSYGLKSTNFVQENLLWNHLNEKKRNSRWEMCHERAKTELKLIHDVENESFSKEVSKTKKPCDCDFISVYDDLLAYRDNSLVWQEQYVKKNILKRESIKEQTELYNQRALRYTIKKRLLIFYLRGEMFSNMDLSGVSFSGADLRGANFSDCNLTGIRLKGTNCEGADFTRSKMTGMYFADVEENFNEKYGEIQLSCRDVPDEKGWNPYKGREITYLQNATFKEADVSRTYLKVPGKLKGWQEFPYAQTASENVWKLDDACESFSLEGTNFDYAKIFFSYFKNVNFSNSSLEKAQMYNTGLVQTKARAANFSSAILTNSCIAWCDFENTNFSNTSLVDAILIRANFCGANMRNVNFANSNIVSCNFEGASCQNASFKNVVQSLTKIEKLELDALKEIELADNVGLRFNYATLTNTDFSGAELNNVSFCSAVGQNCIFTKTEGKGIIFDSAIFNSAVFNADCFINASLKNTIMQNSVFINAKFINSTFINADLSGSIFTVADKMCFIGGSMQEVNFSNVKGLSAANFRNIILREVNFSGTGIQKCDFGNDVTIVNCKF